MINTVAELLRELMLKERAVLDANVVTHAPTIGDMYEGLSQDLLGRSLPADLGLQVVSGFIEDGAGAQSGQIDCMLVRGDGTAIPYTDGFLWHVKDVIAVFEIKKTLYGNELKDAFQHLNQVRDLEKSYNASLTGNDPVDIKSALRAFGQIARRMPPAYDQIDSLRPEQRFLFHTLVSEHLGVLRIIIGYHGFKSEHNFRLALVKYLEENIGKSGFGAGSFPQLIVSGDYSMVKANGQPYSLPLMEDDWWPFYFSTPVNPVLMILEMVWTRLHRLFNLGNLWGEDLEIEVPHALLLAKAELTDDSRPGWNFRFVNTTATSLKNLGEFEAWSPAFLTRAQWVVLHALCVGNDVRFDDDALLVLLAEEGVDDANAFWAALLDTSLVARSGDGSELVLITVNCQTAVLPDGRYVAAENNTGRLSRWIRAEFGIDAMPMSEAMPKRENPGSPT
ncbi:hypothetical protein AERO_01615 [Aeromicrobium fastidiosum]|uniref:DUF6602 domain-containing protein n=1 Tax=Aeromicrobium fastidiosum TaxID=52699 RepID=UPI0020235B39|nr:DUF6602 domain-containing protein [Aeromicrobium fastidiosum]MCL8250068.1 hypothetical protein [Aeromicrobium fastidiosum]